MVLEMRILIALLLAVAVSADCGERNSAESLQSTGFLSWLETGSPKPGRARGRSAGAQEQQRLPIPTHPRRSEQPCPQLVVGGSVPAIRSRHNRGGVRRQ